MLDRAAVFDSLATRIMTLESRALVAVDGVDGVDGAGKTCFADDLAIAIERLDRPVIRAGIDGFHNSRAIRYRRGKHDPEGFFLDSYDYDAFRRYLIDPFRTGMPHVETARFDLETDSIITSARCAAAPNAVLLIDGIFLHRDELSDVWNFSIFLHVPFEISYARMALRDGCDPDPMAVSNRRYHKGQQIYLETCQPSLRASVVIDNTASR